MPEITDRPETARVAASHQAEAAKIAAELAAIARTGMVLPGTIIQRRTRCGHPGCGCRADPPRLHGPYWQWTRKVAAKTVCRWLSPEQRTTTRPGSTTTGGCASCSPGSKPSAPPPWKPTRVGPADPGPPPPIPDRPPHNTVGKPA